MYDRYFTTQSRFFNVATNEAYELNAKIYDKIYAHILPSNKNCEILDVGCGMGHFLYYLIKKGYKNFYGIDISEEQLNICKRFVTSNVEVVDAIVFLKDKKEKYDLIVANDFIEHIDRDTALEFAKLGFKALKKDGILIIKTINMAAPFALSQRYADLTHLCGYNEYSLGQLLRIANFELISFYPSTNQPLKRIIAFLIKFFYKCVGLNVPSIVSSLIIAVGKK